MAGSTFLSVFTPTNNFQHLEETWKSLRTQDYGHFEWIVALNGETYAKVPPAFLLSDSRIRVIEYPQADDKPSVGALKRFCCDQAKGDAYVELDHDDLLAPGILGQLDERFRAGAGFVFSDTAVFRNNEQRTPLYYDERCGWETYPFDYDGYHYEVQQSFPITPRALCDIWFAPDHVRAWSRSAYRLVGGHNPKLRVGDDHDLICRTYIAGFPFSHIPRCGYLYRNHSGNTVKANQAEIKQQSLANRDKFIYPLIDRWTKQEGHGYLDLDKHRSAIERRSDGTCTLDAAPESLGCVRAYDVLQRYSPADAYSLLDAIYQALVPGGWLCIACPSTDGRAAFLPGCQSLWNPLVFECLTDRSRAGQLLAGTNLTFNARFQLVRCFTAFRNKQAREERSPSVYADLCAVKGQRHPGHVLA